jgi:putative CocE/NonD family hydrolase
VKDTQLSSLDLTVVGPPSSLAEFEDEARFEVLQNEESIGTMQSSWRRDGSFSGRSQFTVGGQTVSSSIRVSVDSEGCWTEVVTEAGDGTRTSTRRGTAVTRVFRGSLREQISAFETPSGAVLFDNDALALMSHAIRLYDHAAGGTQYFPVLIGGRPPVPLALEATDQATYSLGSHDLSLTRFRYGVPGTDLFALADDAGKVYLVEHPAQGIVVVRDGFGALRERGDAMDRDPLLSVPEFQVAVERDVRVPVRDGVALSTDIYRPVGVDRAPVVLARTPYKKELLELQARYFARRGYVFAAQDCRGCFGSPGLWEPFVHEGHDGFDTIEWLAAQSYANGHVGMIGGSYMGLVQWLAAAEHPPHLAALVPNVSPTDPFYNAPYEYGAFALAGNLWWADVLESRAAADLSGEGLSRIRQKRFSELLRGLPVIDLDRTVLGAANPYWRAWIEHPAGDAYWKAAEFLDRLRDVHIPVFHQSGWYDDNGLGTKLNYLRMTEHGHPHQKLTLGAWGHTDTATRTIGDRDFGEGAIVNLQRDYLRWFDRWLKGVDNSIEREPLVSVFVMGSNQWLHGDTYPLPETTFRRLYLTSRGNANTINGDGRLTFDPPAAGTPPDRYSYDPGDPTPTSRLQVDPVDDGQLAKSAEERKREADRFRRRLAETRHDILVYETDPLAEPLTSVGPISAVLYAESSARDTDWFVALSEIDHEGAPFRLVQGKIRARFRNSMRASELLEPGKVYAYTLDLWHTGITIPVGNRLRVEVASAAFPLFSRNLNTGGHNEMETAYVTAQQTIYHDDRRPSHVVLPVLSGVGNRESACVAQR